MNTENTSSPAPIRMGSRVKFIERNAFFEGKVMLIDHPPMQKIPLRSTDGHCVAEAIMEPRPILHVAVLGYGEMFKVWIEGAVPV